MDINMQLAYEVAVKVLLEKEKQMLELTIMYNQALKELEELKQQLNKGE